MMMRTSVVLMLAMSVLPASFADDTHGVNHQGFHYQLGAGTVRDFPTSQAVVPLPFTMLDGGMCDGGIPGVQNGLTCCHEGCSQCGGRGCGRAGAGGASDCCTGAIGRSGTQCDQAGAGPCLLSSDDDSDDAPVPAPVPAPAPDAPPADMVTLLDLHNEARCQHNADPLTWNADVEASAAEYAGILTTTSNCGVLAHSTSEQRNGYGENLFACWGSASCYTAEFAMSLLYDGEVTTSVVTGYGGHATQILWKSTTQLGCAVASCSDNGVPYTALVCQYNPPGNYMNILEQEVELPSGASC